MGILYNQKKRNAARLNLRRSMPKAEVYLWMFLKGKQISGYKFRRQYSVGSHIIDFYCPALKLAVEVDGDVHLGYVRSVKDGLRQKKLELMGIKFLRFANNEIYGDMANVLEGIEKEIKKMERSYLSEQRRTKVLSKSL